MSLKKKLLNCLFTGTFAPWLTEVEWLQTPYDYATSNRPYINTGIVADWDVPTEIVATITKTVANRTVIIGNYANSLTFSLETTATNRLRMYVSNSTSVNPSYVTVDALTNSSYPIQLNEPTKVWLKFTPLNDSAHTVNYELGLEVLTTSVTTTAKGSFSRYGQTPTSRTLRLFNDYRSNIDTFDGGFKLHQLEVKVGTKHQKYIPCLDKNGNPCMYEQISGNLFYNEDPISFFNYGRKITEVEWINLTGSQRFNTGFKPNTLSTTLKATLQLTGSDSLSRFPFGCRKETGQADSCAIYIAPVTSANPNGYLRLDWPFQASNPRYSIVSSTEKITLEITGNYSNINGEINTSSNVTSYDQAAPFYIGNCYTSSASGFQSAFVGKFYVVNLLNTYSRENYRYCVPAHDENNVGFFFDRVNHFIIDNEGSNTQDMTWGDEIHPVSYLYGGGSSRFNTAIPFYNHAWETDVRCNSIRTNTNLMGSTTGACNYWGVLDSNTTYGVTYTLHTSSGNYGLTIDPTETRTVFLDMGLDTDNTTYRLAMNVEGENVVRTYSSANTTTGYKIPNFSESYSEPTYIYGNRCYNRTTKELIQNLVPVQNGQRVPFLFDTMSHTMIATTISTADFEKGADVLGYDTALQLPYGFVEVDYLESTGEQYIDTGVKLGSDYGVEIVARQTNETTGKSRYMFGTATATNRYMLAVGSTTDNYLFDLESSSYRVDSSFNAYDGQFHTHKIENKTYYIDGVSQGTSTSTATFTASISAFLFGVAGVARTNCYWQIRKCKIFNETGRIIADYVPCLRIYDNKPGMFDLITRQFLTNQGTGEFIVGIDGVGYTPADYLESTGTQWIDTGITLKSSYGVEIEAKQTSATTGVGRYLFGDAPASTGRYLIVVTPGANTYRLGLDTLNKDSNVSAYDGQWHTHKVENKTYYIDGVSKGSLSVTDFTCNRNARLFSVATTSTLIDNYWQIKRCTIKDENNNKLANFVPMVRASDNKPGMFDFVSRTLCVNGAGGTDFTVGAR